ncbi:hypothetical protein [Dictyobacter arantiisoli]|uniref:Uncharacterized protein n=1 Tax=Dictyobacter arantiisoli TaxID=2014874 RepID=A0A5A5TFQ0_9CHLR|nr:hypothetical protein [Dictyobacter arantiisoli]GCF10400.1 hypothetical protein KDI_39640 [Dictyobacter arantiisoli]
MLAEEFSVIDAASPLWNAARPLLDIALRIEQQSASYSWHGWQKKDLDAFLKALPVHCSLLVGVWQIDVSLEHEDLWLGCVCEVINGEVHSMRTFDALTSDDLPPIAQLEPGFTHAQVLMLTAEKLVAPVAWALFTDKTTWDEWLLTEATSVEQADTSHNEKGDLLAALVRQGRCVLLGSQLTHHNHHHS